MSSVNFSKTLDFKYNFTQSDFQSPLSFTSSSIEPHSLRNVAPTSPQAMGGEITWMHTCSRASRLQHCCIITVGEGDGTTPF